MSDTVISVEHLSKRYRLGVINTGTFKDDLRVWLAKARGYENPLAKIGEKDYGNSDGESVWALKDVNFTVQRGEALGIIGRNGAGKSTLLKILSRVTAPTEGHMRVKGRIASLLEVGTGFHPELTGRENIFLNGAIMGMSQAEVGRKLDEIIEFSGVEKFIDTPVKRYSSGMYVRLAFAVAAHLEPEILVVDEVLAVGDAEFQKKCLGKMGEATGEGRTVLFVSHNMSAIRQLCSETIWINQGTINMRGQTQNIVDQYLKQSSLISSDEKDFTEIIRDLPSDPEFKLYSIKITQDNSPVHNVVLSGNPLDIEINYSVLQRITGFRIYVDLLDNEKDLIFRSFHDNDAKGIPITEPGSYISSVSIPANILAPKTYYLKINATIYNIRSILPLDGIFIPISVNHTGSYNQGYVSDTIRGQLAPVLSWTTKKNAENRSDTC